MSRVKEFVPADYRYHRELEWYKGTITGIEDKDFGFGDTVVFNIVLEDDGDDDDGNPRIVKAMASDKLTANSKLTRWVKGIFGEDAVGPGKVVDLDFAVNEAVEVMFEFSENKSGDPDEKITQIRAAR